MYFFFFNTIFPDMFLYDLYVHVYGFNQYDPTPKGWKENRPSTRQRVVDRQPSGGDALPDRFVCFDSRIMFS